MESYDRKSREPLFEFTHPVGQGGEGGDNDEGTGDVHCAEVGNEGNDLDGFSAMMYFLFMMHVEDD